MKHNQTKPIVSVLLCVLLLIAAVFPVSAANGADIWENDFAYFMFWSTFLFISFILPAFLCILGVVLARSASRGHPKYWYILSIIALVWIVAFAALWLLLLFG